MAKIHSHAVEFGAGASVGTLVGLIVGLSASAVVSTVLGAISAGLLGLLGMSKSSSNAQPDGGSRSLATFRILGFGAFCSLFLLVGILLRTHDVLAPSLESQNQELAKSNIFSRAEIQQILLLKQFGLAPAANDPSALRISNPKNPSGTGVSTGILFAGNTEICNVIRRDQYASPAAYVEGLKAHGGEFANLANIIGRQSVQDQEAFATTLSKLLCD